MRFDGIDPSTLHPGISIAKEIPPGAMTSQVETLSGSTGEIVTRRTVKQGEYIVRMNIAGKSRAEAWQIRALIAGWARADDEETHQLIPTHWPEVSYDAILKEISEPEFVFGFATVEVVFLLPCPVARSLTEKTAGTEMETRAIQGGDEIGYETFLTNGGYVYNTADGEVFMTRADGEGNLRIGGTTWTRPNITVHMQESERMTLYVDNQPMISLYGEYKAGDVIYIQTEPPSVVLVSDMTVYQIDDRIDYTVTDFEALCRAMTPGTHTVEAVGAEQVIVAWRDTWL